MLVFSKLDTMLSKGDMGVVSGVSDVKYASRMRRDVCKSSKKHGYVPIGDG